jgi:hypothetical protein
VVYSTERIAMRTAMTHIVMFLPMFFAAGLLVAAGAGTAALILALACALMMVAMLVIVVRGRDSDR